MCLQFVVAGDDEPAGMLAFLELYACPRSRGVPSPIFFLGRRSYFLWFGPGFAVVGGM